MAKFLCRNSQTNIISDILNMILETGAGIYITPVIHRFYEAYIW